MGQGLAPIPNLPVGNSHEWREWFFNLWQSLGGAQGQILFTDLNFTGSNLDSIQTRIHNHLQGLQGGNVGGTEYYHLSAAEYAAIIAGYSPKSGAFHYDYTTTTTAAITNTATTIPVVSTFGFSSTGALIIQNEIVTYTGITPTSFTGVTRGVNGSNNVAHAINTPIGGAQTIGTPMTPATVQINTVDFTNGVSLDTTTSEISVSQNGTYNIQYSIQMFNSSNTQDLSNIWFVLNGVNVPSSASWVTTSARANINTPASSIITVNLFLTLSSTDKLTLKWLSTSGNSTIVTYPGSGTSYPSAPAVIVTVNQVA